MIRSPRLHDLLFPTIALALGTVAGLSCWWAAGATCGLFFGGLAFSALLVPPLVSAEARWAQQISVALSTALGTSLAWLSATVSSRDLTAAHWLRCTLLLACFAAALAGLTALLRRAHLNPTAAAAIVVLLALLWLTWPIWLSPALAGREELVGWLTPAHPILAADSALTGLGPAWTERRLMYTKLSILNQDVAYGLPETIAWSVLLHTLTGATAFAGAALRRPT